MKERIAPEKVVYAQIKEVLRLRFDLGLNQDQIAGVVRWAKRQFIAIWIELRPTTWAGRCQTMSMTGGSMSFCFPHDHCGHNQSFSLGLDFGQIHSQLQIHKHLTLQLLSEEYPRRRSQASYGYSRFCELYQRWNRSRDVVLRHDHKAGEKTFVDWAGDTVPIHDHQTGETTAASIFVAVLGASTYTFCTSCTQPGPGELD